MEEVRAELLIEGVDDLGDGEVLGFGHGGGEGFPETAHHLLPVDLAAGDVVQPVLHPGGEVVLDVTLEEADEEGGDEPAAVLGPEALLLQPHIIALLQDRDDRGVGRWPADAKLFHALDQRRLGVSRRRLGEVLLRDHLAARQGLPLGKPGECLFAVGALGGIVPAFLVETEEAVEGHGRAGGAQRRSVGGGDVDRHLIEARAFHLARYRPFPDQLVKPELVGIEQPDDLLG